MKTFFGGRRVIIEFFKIFDPWYEWTKYKILRDFKQLNFK